MSSQVKVENLRNLVETIFLDGEVTVYEAYSIPDKELRVFVSPEEVMAYISEVESSKDDLAYLSIHYANAGGFVRKKKVDLNPEKCKGAKVRYSVEGWGLIQFQLWNKASGLTCDIAVNSEKRANAWEATNPELKSPSLWNWKEVQKHNRKLNRVLKSSA